VVILDTNVIIDRVKRGEEIRENITGVTFVEYPAIVRYKKFYGNVLFPTVDDFLWPIRFRKRFLKMGKPKTFADL